MATLGETTGHSALQTMHSLMKSNKTGQDVLKDKPRITQDTMDMRYKDISSKLQFYIPAVYVDSCLVIQF